MAHIVVILLGLSTQPGPLPSQQGSCQETVGTEGLEAPWLGMRGLEKRQPSWNSVYAGSQRWSLLGDSRLGALGPLAQCVVMASPARAKRTPASPCPAQTPKAHVETVDFGSFSPNSF